MKYPSGISVEAARHDDDDKPIDGSNQVLPFRARVELGAMAVKGYSAFPQTPESLEPHHQIV